MDTYSKSNIGTTINSLRELQNKNNENNNFINQEVMEEPIQNSKSKNEDFDIEELTKDINDNIQDDTFLSLTEEDDNKDKSYIPFGWKEPLLLLFIYLLLSQSLVKQFIGKYIPQLNPGPDGTVGFLGVLIYGILLVVLYFASKKLFVS